MCTEHNSGGQHADVTLGTTRADHVCYLHNELLVSRRDIGPFGGDDACEISREGRNRRVEVFARDTHDMHTAWKYEGDPEEAGRGKRCVKATRFPNVAAASILRSQLV